MKDGEVALVFNTTEGAQAVSDSKEIRALALYRRIPYYTTAAGANAPPRARSTSRLKACRTGASRPAGTTGGVCGAPSRSGTDLLPQRVTPKAFVK
jgi:hypothetical protein